MYLENIQLFCSLLLIFASSYIFNSHGVTAIRGGNFDYDNKFNYQVSIQKKKNNSRYEHGCGGAIIGNKQILTAAHCFVSKKGQVLDPTNGRMRILAGTSNLRRGGVVRYIDKVIVPKSYRHENHLAIDDIAVVQLRNSLFEGLDRQQRRNLQIIPLFRSFDYAELQNQTAVVSGFGLTERNGTAASDTRKYLEVKITKERDCTELDGIVCVFRQRLGTLDAQGFCFGDSGGPVVLDGKLLGVVSRGAKADCDLTRRVGKLTLVPRYLDFIRKSMSGDSRGESDVIVLPDMAREAETIFKPTTPSSRRVRA